MARSASNVRHLPSASAATSTWPPEAFFISALIDEGIYRPGKYEISDKHFSAFKDVHRFCLEYQAKTGQAPPRELVKAKFPGFPMLLEPIGGKWAADDLIHAWIGRRLHKANGVFIEHLRDGDYGKAIAAMQQGIKEATPALGKGSSVSDVDDIERGNDVLRANIDYARGQLQRLTGGAGAGELWYLAARLGVGKTWHLDKIAISAAEDGWNVVIFSLEMPAKSVKSRLHRIALRDDVKDMTTLTIQRRRELMETWQASAGKITVYDPSTGPCDAARVSSACEDTTLVIVDHVGLMRTTSGDRAISDWRAAATISNELKEVALEYSTPIIAAAQINREGQNAKTMGAEHLSQSDALGQDADVLMTLREHSTRVRINKLVKNRDGVQGVLWYTRFEPHTGRFEDIDASTAHTLKSADDELAASRLE